MKNIIALLFLFIPFLGCSQEKEKNFFVYQCVSSSLGKFDKEKMDYIWEKTDTLNIPFVLDLDSFKIYIYKKEQIIFDIYDAQRLSEDERGIIWQLYCITNKEEKIKATYYLPLKNGYLHMIIVDYNEYIIKYILEEYKSRNTYNKI